MSRVAPRPGWDWTTDRVMEGPAPAARVQLVVHEHTCPDGTHAVVSGQFISQTGVTLYRWRVDGAPAGTTSRLGPASDPPDWSTVDSEHTITQGSDLVVV